MPLVDKEASYRWRLVGRDGPGRCWIDKLRFRIGYTQSEKAEDLINSGTVTRQARELTFGVYSYDEAGFIMDDPNGPDPWN